MTLLNKIQDEFEQKDFDLEHETDMVQSRILSPIIEKIEEQGLTQTNLSEITGLKQPFLSALFNIRKRLNMEHIALLQKALGIVLQSPQMLSIVEHKRKFYSKDEYDISSLQVSESVYHVRTHELYRKSTKKIDYIKKKSISLGSSETKLSKYEYEANAFLI